MAPPRGRARFPAMPTPADGKLVGLEGSPGARKVWAQSPPDWRGTACHRPGTWRSAHPQMLTDAQLDVLLTLQLATAWAGERSGDEPPRLGWWATDMVSEFGGHALFAPHRQVGRPRGSP